MISPSSLGFSSNNTRQALPVPERNWTPLARKRNERCDGGRTALSKRRGRREAPLAWDEPGGKLVRPAVERRSCPRVPRVVEAERRINFSPRRNRIAHKNEISSAAFSFDRASADTLSSRDWALEKRWGRYSHARVHQRRTLQASLEGQELPERSV